jgi:hypothetical protein
MPPQDVITNWNSFEHVVAGLYRALEIPVVKQNIDLAGNQIDVYTEERTASGTLVRTAVECKFLGRAAPKDLVVQFSVTAHFLRQAGLIDKAVIVSYQGFTQAASIAAEAGSVELVTLAELESRVIHRPRSKYQAQVGPELSRIFAEAQEAPVASAFPTTVFVAMPFSEDLEDLYLYGIRKAVADLGLTCRRADEVEHSQGVIDEIVDQIKRCRVIVAEISDRNPNVFYEVGWAHALQRDTILIARQGIEIPFDVRHINTILYKSIHQLEERLHARLSALTAKTPGHERPVA